MIRLKSGTVVELDDDFDAFLKELLKCMVSESIDAAGAVVRDSGDDFNRLMLKELMDNSIFVTHQLFEIYGHNANLAKFLVTGFIFNSLAQSLPSLAGDILKEFNAGPGDDTLH
jgi:hypothetical protein